MPEATHPTVSVDLARDEIVTSEPKVSIRCPAAASAEEVERSIAVRGADGEVTGTRGRGMYRWSPAEPLRPGRHVLVVEPLPDGSGASTEPVEVPFFVVETKAKVPARLRIEGFRRVALSADGPRSLSITAPPRGKFVEFVKAEDRRTRRPVALAFDESGEEVDGDALLAAALERTARRTDGLQRALYQAIEDAKEGDRVLVDIWIDLDEGEPSPGDRPMQDGHAEMWRQRATEQRRRCQVRCDALVDRLAEFGELVESPSLAPVVTLRVPVERVRELAADDEVAAVFLHDDTAVEDLADSIAIAQSGVVHAAGECGEGIDVAVWERGPTSNSDLVISGRYLNNPSTSNHSQNVHAIIRNDEPGTPNGHAPCCNLFSANSFDRAALTWAVEDQGCTVINQSFHRSTEPGSGELSSDDLYGDYLALHWPYPTIVHAAGNFWSTDPDGISPPSSEFVNHKGYNTISVGNHNDNATAMSAGSVFRNPNSGHGDRELPEIAANGTFVTADGIQLSGTSMASPAVAGVTALLQGTDETLRHWPEGCRAILAAGATRNVKDDTWWQDVQGGVDASDGTGAVNAAEGWRIAQKQRYRNAPPTQRGWDTGLLTSADFAPDKLSKFEYGVTIPSTWWGPRHVKVALCWTSKVGRNDGPTYTSALTVDLDLKIYDSSGNQVGYSGSWDNSYEIAEFTGSPGQTYTIKIRRWSGTDSTWYGIAWTVTGGLRIEIPWEYLDQRAAPRW